MNNPAGEQNARATNSDPRSRRERVLCLNSYRNSERETHSGLVEAECDSSSAGRNLPTPAPSSSPLPGKKRSATSDVEFPANGLRQLGTCNAKPAPSSPTKEAKRVRTEPDNVPATPESATHPDTLAQARYSGILSQPNSRPITSKQLEGEIRKIYKDLVAVEAKCISLDEAELANDSKCITSQEREKWQAMMALHRTLLYEHHDFLSASQHPAADESLKRLALKYHMPARMWKYGIHSFLEVLRRRLPDSMDYMLQFNYMAYQMIALLYETVVAFKPTWIECLGDLARYRMAIEDGNQRDRDIWGEVARSWYSTASDISPDTGRLYHHLGILARPNAVEQLSLYCRSLICVSPFQNAHESLSNLLTSALSPEKAGRTVLCIHELDATFIHIHAAMYTQLAQKAEKSVSFEDVYEKQGMYIAGLAGQIDYLGERWKKHGVCIAIANIAACLGYGDEGTDNPILAALTSLSDATESVQLSDSDWSSLMQATGLLFSVLAVALSRKADFTVLPHVHVLLVFIRGVVSLSFGSAPYLQTFVDLVPWLELGAFLNSFPRPDTISEDVLDAADLRAVERRACPLFEDYSLRGAVWGRNYLAEKWFTNSSDDSTGEVEELSANDTRLQRVLWLGVSISKRVNHLRFNADSMTFIDGHRYSQ